MSDIIYSNSGDKIVKEYVLKDDGRLELVGTSDIQLEIESYKSSTDYKALIDSIVGFDDERLHVNRGVYMDTTVCPKHVSEVVDLGKYNSRKISGLPTELKSLSIEEFLNMSTDDIISILDSKNKKINNNENVENNEVINNE